MTQKEFSVITGLSESFISMWLSGQRRPGYRAAKKLSEMFGLPIEFWVESRPDRIKVFMDRLSVDDFGNKNNKAEY